MQAVVDHGPNSDVAVDWSSISDDKELDVVGTHLGSHCWPAAGRVLESAGSRSPRSSLISCR